MAVRALLSHRWFLGYRGNQRAVYTAVRQHHRRLLESETELFCVQWLPVVIAFNIGTVYNHNFPVW
jgi:hypothetical protein